MSDHTFPQPSDPNDAENFATWLGRQELSNFVEFGLNINNVSSGTYDLSSGKFHVYTQNPVSASNNGSPEDRYGTSFYSYVDQRTNLSYTTGQMNYVYVTLDKNTDDNITIETKDTDSPPTDFSLKLGEIDGSTDTATEVNRNFQVSEDNISELSIGNSHPSSPEDGHISIRTDQSGTLYIYNPDTSSWDEIIDQDNLTSQLDHTNLSNISSDDHHTKPSSTQNSGSYGGWMDYSDGTISANDTINLNPEPDIIMIDSVEVCSNGNNPQQLSVGVSGDGISENFTVNAGSCNSVSFSPEDVDGVSITNEGSDTSGYTLKLHERSMPPHSHSI